MNFNFPNFLITFLKIFFIFFVRFWRYEIKDFVKIESNKKKASPRRCGRNRAFANNFES